MNEIAKKLMCIQMRSGVELWVEDESIAKLKESLQENTSHGFLNIGNTGEVINTADIVGVFTGRTMEDVRRRKNGEWKCKGLKWHQRDEKKCTHIDKHTMNVKEMRESAISECSRCDNGWVNGKYGMKKCECIKNI